MDMVERPGKVLAACEALAPHLLHVALSSADPDRQVPVGFWMHRGCVPFRHAGPIRVALLAHFEADHRGTLGARPPDALLRRGELELPPRQLRRAPRPQPVVFHADKGGHLLSPHRQ